MLRPASSRFAVLSLETVLCPDSAALVPENLRAPHSIALQKLACITLLSGEEKAGRFQVEELRSLSLNEHDEADMIGMLDMLLPPLLPRNILVTFGGTQRDLLILKLRACALWMVPLENLAAWTRAPTCQHVDIQRDVYGGSAGARLGLPEIAAAQGLAILGRVPAKSIRWLYKHGRDEEIRERNRMKAAATFISYAAHRSFMTGCDGYLISAWSELGRIFDEGSRGRVNPLTGHCFVAAARQALEPPSEAAADEPF